MKEMNYCYNFKDTKSFLSFLQLRDILKENKYLVFCNITDAKLVWKFKCVLLELGIFSKTIRSPRLHKLFKSRSFYFIKGEVLIIWVNTLNMFMLLLKCINQKNLLMGFSCNYSLSNYTNIRNLVLWNDNKEGLYKAIYKYIYFVMYKILKSLEYLKSGK